MKIECSCGYKFSEDELVNSDNCIECKCGKLLDVCTCKTSLIEVDDYGVALCSECLNSNPQAKKAIFNGNYNDSILFGD